jgi:iron complex outermembrane receptor protein
LTRSCTLLAAVLCFELGVPSALAAGSPSDLADATLEQLMNIKVVSVGKKAQSLKTTAASAFVITAEDIRRSGMHSLPELLRLAPGVQVARTISGHWAISIRGFNGDFANKLLVLVDGRVVYNEEWAGVFWDMEELPLENIERIEVVRGPGAAMWGANAVNGVINILTKPAEATQGGLVTGEAGTKDANSSARYGGAIGSDAFYRITGRFGDTAALPAAPSNPGGGLTASHGWTSDSMDFRVDWKPASRDTLFFSGQVYHSSMGDPASFVTLQNPYAPLVNVQEESLAGNLMGQWQHTFANGSSLEGRVSWDRIDYGLGKLPTSITAVGSELQYHFSWGSRNDLVWGADFRQQDFLASSSPGNSLVPARQSLESYDTFLEDQITLVPDRFFFIAGVNVGHIAFTGLAVQPTGRLLWTPNKKLTTWAAVSRAVRTPSLIERGMDYNLAAFPAAPQLLGITTLVGNSSAGAETVLAYEAGQRVQLHQRVSLDLSVFVNRYQHLLFFADAPAVLVPGLVPYLDVPITFDNAYHGQSHGLELSAAWTAASHWRLIAGYSWLSVQTAPYPGWQPPPVPINNAPGSQWQLRSNWDLTRKLQLDTALYYTGEIPEQSVASHLRGDLRLGWRIGEKTELSTGVQDAFEPYHSELPSLYQSQQLLVGRDIYGAITWRF